MNETTNHIVLMDAKSEVASWPLNSGSRPTVGDRIDVTIGARGTGYGNSGTVTKVEVNQRNGVCRIVVEADCPLANEQRPVVSLNANLIPDRLRKEVEAHLRSRLDFPVLEWMESYETRPIVQVHEGSTPLKTPLRTLQSELRDILEKAVDLAVL